MELDEEGDVVELVAPRRKGGRRAVNGGLTDVEKQFVIAYLTMPVPCIDEAARRINMNPKRVDRLVARPRVKQFINIVETHVIKKINPTAADVAEVLELVRTKYLEELDCLSFQNVKNCFKVDPNNPGREVFKNVLEMGNEARAISSVKIKRFKDRQGNDVEEREFTFWSKTEAMKLRLQNLGMLKEVVNNFNIISPVILPDNGSHNIEEAEVVARPISCLERPG